MRILRGIGSRTLPCGCLVGLYETYDRQTVAIIDAHCSTCADTKHVVDAIITIDITGTNTLQALNTTA
jgi:hypothetical protein